MRKVATSVGETVRLCVRQNDEVVYVERIIVNRNTITGGANGWLERPCTSRR